MEIICSHENLDFDGLAAMIGVQKLYPDAKLVLPNKLSQPVREYLALYKDIFSFYRYSQLQDKTEQVKTVILVDINQLQRVEFAQRCVQQGAALIVYDHHRFKTGTLPPWQGRIEPVGATSTLIVEETLGRGIKLSPIEATLLAMGIYQDTGSLRFMGTTDRDAKAVADLLAAGAKLSVVNTFLDRPLNHEQQQLYNVLMANGEEKWINGTHILVCSAQTVKPVGGIALITNKLIEHSGADAVITAVANPKHVDLVARSRADWVRIDRLLEQFGGGGHPKAGAAKIKGAGLPEVLAKLNVLLASFVPAPLTAGNLMSSPVKSLDPNQTIQEAARLMLRYGHSGMPVVEQGKLVGVISRRDVDKAIHHNLGHAPVKAYMSRNVKIVSPETPITQIERAMINHDIGRLPVCDNGSLVGIVTRTDLLRVMHGEYPSKFSVNFCPYGAPMQANFQELIQQRFSPEIVQFLIRAGELGKQGGQPAFLVGGTVRDMILGHPNQDIDIVVEGNAPKLAQQLALEYDARVRVHEAFQTATVQLPSGHRFDFASARTEFYAFPAALPTVESGSLREDLYRRDFTVNAMAVSLAPDTFGQLVDYFCGYRDTIDGCIRVLHNLSFVEDPTRILRALRFKTRFNWSIEEETYRFLLAAIKEERISQVSLSRLWHELRIILTEEEPLPILESMAYLRIEKQVFPGIEWDHRVFRALARARELIAQLPPSIKAVPWRIYLSILLSPCSIHGIPALLQEMGLNRKVRQVIESVFLVQEELAHTGLSQADFLGWIHETCRDKDNDTLLALSALVTPQDMGNHFYAYLLKRNEIKPALTGDDLIQLGVHPGPRLGTILRQIELARLTGKVASREEELLLAAQLARGGE
ncbi:MAG TPA: CBS domain-containing protein [Clostridia bacterium]|nr:CBS domain-containing protein [Clostridia bacterium]